MASKPNQRDANPHRGLPSVDKLLQHMAVDVQRWGRTLMTTTVRDVLTQLRAQISAGHLVDCSMDAICNTTRAGLAGLDQGGLKPVINLTGTILHTNLGRAPLPQEALEAVTRVAGTASNLEFDLATGERGDRDVHVEQLICDLTGAEAATVVNNNAAAVLLVLNTLAMNREVPVSRGELVEIGGSFRIPEVMERSGCRLVEVGATNRTHLRDYRSAIGEQTAALMKVHTSNYQMQGFTLEVAENELADLAHEHGLPLLIDLGSGNLIDFKALGLPEEQTAAQVLAQGADIITFSGDKLLGGPQAGLIAGRRDLIAAIKKNPLKRALRLDKMTLAALAAVLALYRDPDTVCQRLPTLRQLTRPVAEISAQAQILLGPLQQALGSAFQVAVAPCHSQIGSGSLPVDTLPSTALKIVTGNGEDSALRSLLQALRQLPVPVIGRLHKRALWLDLRALEAEQQQVLLTQLAQLHQ